MKCINCNQTIAIKPVGKPLKWVPCSYYLPGGSNPNSVGPFCLICYQIAMGIKMFNVKDRVVLKERFIHGSVQRSSTTIPGEILQIKDNLCHVKFWDNTTQWILKKKLRLWAQQNS